MKPKEKAEELVRKYYTFGINNTLFSSYSWYECKMLALISVDEILNSHYTAFSGIKPSIYNYWKEVKREIEKL